MKEKPISIDLVYHIIDDLKGAGESSLSFDECLCVLDTVKQVLLYKKTMQNRASSRNLGERFRELCP